MLQDKLEELLSILNRLEPPEPTEGWQAPAFDRLNATLSAILDGAADRLGMFRERMNLRRGIQDVFKRAGAIDPVVAREIWSEQCGFYTQLVADIQQCIGEEKHSTIAFSMSVAELLLLLRVFVESGSLQTQAMRPIFAFLATHAQTKRGQKLSLDSLRKKYSQVRPDTRERVKRLLRDLAIRVDST